MSDKIDVFYILTNLSFLEYVKIGYVEDIDTESHEKAEKFFFPKCLIPVGEEIEYGNDQM